MNSNKAWGEMDFWQPPLRKIVEESSPVGTHYRPTLVVGLGGTGCKVVQKLMRLVHQLYGESRAQAFQFIALDTDIQEAQTEEEQLGPDVFFNLARPYIAVTRIVDAMHRHGLHPYLKEWWPHFTPRGQSPRPYRPPKDVTQGAHAVRPIGRFALWNQGYKVERLLEEKWHAALNAREPSGDIVTASSAKIYLVCSLAGGTGSGMFIDTAYMLKRITGERTFPVYFTGFLLMDATPFESYAPLPSIRARMHANVYAALTELDYFMRRQPSGEGPLYRFRYNKTLEVSSDESPFDVCYLCGVTNEMGFKLRDLDSICHMIAEAIYLEIASPMGDKGSSVLDNLEILQHSTAIQVKDDAYIERPLAYSSFSVASLTYARDLVAEYCARELTFGAIEDLAKAIAPSAVHSASAADLSELNLTWKSILDQIEEGDLGESSVKVMLSTMDADVGTEIGQADDGLEGIQRQVDSRKGTYLEKIQQRVLDWGLDQVVNGRTGSLQALTNRLALEQELIGGQINKYERATKNEGDEADRKIQEYGEARSKAKGKGTPSLQGILDDLREHENAYLSNRVSLAKYRAVQSILNTLQSQVKTITDKLRLIDEEWKHEKKKVGEILNGFRRNGIVPGPYSLGFSALTPQGLDALVKLFQGSDSAVHRQTMQMLHRLLRESIEDGTDYKLRELPRRLYEAFLDSLKKTEQIGKNDLFQIIKECECQDQKEEYAGIDRAIKRLQAYAPFWNVQTALFNDPEEIGAINLVGFESVQEGGRPAEWQERLRTLLEQATPVSHGVHDKLILMQTKHGAPAYAVAAHNEGMRDAYQDFVARWKRSGLGVQPVHLTSAWCNGKIEDMNPTPWITSEQSKSKEPSPAQTERSRRGRRGRQRVRG